METKMAVSFANIFMDKIETMLSKTKATEWRRYIDNIFSLWDSDEKDVDQFIEQANKFHPTIKFVAERERDYFPRHSGVQRRKIKKNNSFWTSKLTTNLSFQYTLSNSCHPPSVKNGFIKGKVMRLLRTNSSSKTTFEESLEKFKQHLRTRGYPKTVIERSLSGVNFADRPLALTQKKAIERILPFVTTYHPAVNNLKQTLMEQWSLTQNQPAENHLFETSDNIVQKR